MAATTSDEDGFREIQLSGKQMFFLFMAATTVLVVAFMLGMLVGRGVRAEREEVASTETLSPAAPAERSSLPTPDDADPRKAAPPAPPENDAEAKSAKAADTNEEPQVAVSRNPQDASKRAEASKAAKAAESTATKPSDAAKPSAQASKPSDTAPKQVADAKTAPKTPEAKPAPPAPKPEPPKAVAPAPAPAPAAAATAPSADRNGFAVQVAAVNARGEADAIAKRLSGKGYPAYVEVPKGSASTFRVRVGTYQTRHEAQDIADKLKSSENFKPWVTR